MQEFGDEQGAAKILARDLLKPARFDQCIRSTGIGQGTSVLDVGCGAGGFYRLAADAGASINGIDAAAGMIAVASESAPDARVESRSAGRRFVVVFGREEQPARPVLHAIRALLPTIPPRVPGPLALSAPGVLVALLGRLGLAVDEEGFLDTAYEYPDLDTALRAVRSAGLTVLAERTAGEALVTQAITSALGPYRTAFGGYRLAAESRYINATA